VARTGNEELQDIETAERGESILPSLNHSPADVCRVLDTLGAWLRQPQQAELGRSFVDWLREVLLPRRMPGVDMPELENLREVRTLLAERVKEWTQQ
jgi:hypothetical protein